MAATGLPVESECHLASDRGRDTLYKTHTIAWNNDNPVDGSSDAWRSVAAASSHPVLKPRTPLRKYLGIPGIPGELPGPSPACPYLDPFATSRSD
jgi:hypothetical protein